MRRLCCLLLLVPALLCAAGAAMPLKVSENNR